jgi:hypothetical protein
MRLKILSILLCLACSGTAVAQDVIRLLPPEQAVDLLRKRKVAFNKSPADAKGNSVFDYKKDGVSMAFYLFDGGKDIMVDAVMPVLPIELVNQWNAGAKYTRACARREGTQVITILDANLDLDAGVTLEAVDRFLDNFEAEVKTFNSFVTRSIKDEPVFERVDDEQIEKLLSRLGLKFARKNGRDATMFDFQMQGHKVRLTSLKGKELFLDAVFPLLPLDKANRYNLQKKFVRIVNLKADDEVYTALQTGLDLTGGVSKTILTHFVSSFEAEIEQFADFRTKTFKE